MWQIKHTHTLFPVFCHPQKHTRVSHGHPLIPQAPNLKVNIVSDGAGTRRQTFAQCFCWNLVGISTFGERDGLEEPGVPFYLDVQMSHINQKLWARLHLLYLVSVIMSCHLESRAGWLKAKSTSRLFLNYNKILIIHLFEKSYSSRAIKYNLDANLFLIKHSNDKFYFWMSWIYRSY